MNKLDVLKQKSQARMARSPEALIELLYDGIVDLTAKEAVTLKLHLKENGVHTPYYQDPADLAAYSHELFTA